MRVFLDENVDPRLAEWLSEHEVESVKSKGWFGVSNGELLSRIEEEFDLLISHDRGLAFQQNWHGRSISLLILATVSTEFASYENELTRIIEMIRTSTAGQVQQFDLMEQS